MLTLLGGSPNYTAYEYTQTKQPKQVSNFSNHCSPPFLFPSTPIMLHKGNEQKMHLQAYCLRKRNDATIPFFRNYEKESKLRRIVFKLEIYAS